MVEPAELRPDELDRVEDALELLEVAGIDDPSPVVRERLGEFRRILQLSRTALPLVEVPHGLLDRVMLEARHAAELPVVAPVAGEPAAPQPGFWAKLRRFALLPGVALAGAAALVLIMVERNDASPVATSAKQDQVAKLEPAADARASEASRSAGGPLLSPEPEAAARAPGSAATGVAGEVTAAPTPASPPPPAVVMPSAADEAKPKLAKERGELEDAAPMEESVTDPKADPADGNTPRWDIIARGDRARHKGDCGGARTEYELALGDTDARVRARAHAGLGLCSAAEGSRAAADSAYKAARELDPEITGFIETERPRGGGTGSANAARAKKKPKAAPAEAQQQKVDAFDPAN